MVGHRSFSTENWVEPYDGKPHLSLSHGIAPIGHEFVLKSMVPGFAGGGLDLLCDMRQAST